MGVEREQRHTRRNPCPVCGGGGDMPRGAGTRCAGFTSADGEWVRCERMGEAEGAELDTRCSPPAYKWKRREDGEYRAWTKDLPPTPVRVQKRRDGAYSANTGHSATAARAATTAPKADTKSHERREGERVWRYSDTQRVYRRDFRNLKKGGAWDKDVKPQHRNAAGEWVFGNGPGFIHRIYPPAPPIVTDGPVLVPEGEPAVDDLAALGFAAVTWRGGCGQANQALEQLRATLRGQDVVLLPDAEGGRGKGRDTMAMIAAALVGVAARVRILDLYPGDNESKRDVQDWLHDGGDAHALAARIATAPDFVPLERDGADAGGAPVATGQWQPKITYLSDVQPERVAWLWYGRVALGKVGLLDGDPGDGKSTLTTDLAARVSTGREMPDGTPGLGFPAGVVLLSAEDGLADTIRPRLDAAGGDPARVVALECATDGDRERGVTLADLPFIEAAITGVDARLVVVDPLMAYLGSDTDSYRDQDVRGILAPLARLAERTGVAILVVRHFSKGATAKVIHKGGGSVGIVGAVRTAMMVARDPDDPEGPRRILAQTKSNVAAFPPSLAFHMEESANGAARIVWEGVSTHTAAALNALPTEPGERSALDEACDVLRHILAAGRVDAKTAQQEAKAAGISEATLRRAKTTLRVKSDSNGFGKERVWFWALPPEDDAHRCSTPPIDAHPREDEHLSETVRTYDAYKGEALPQGGENAPAVIDAQPQYREIPAPPLAAPSHTDPTPEDIAWAKAHIQSGTLSFAAIDLARVRRLCGGSFDTRTWRADVCERYGWPTPPPLALPPPSAPVDLAAFGFQEEGGDDAA